jgi:hypothetical protein
MKRRILMEMVPFKKSKKNKKVNLGVLVPRKTHGSVNHMLKREKRKDKNK